MPLINSKKNVFIFWDSGFEQAPHLVQSCLESWNHQHKTTDWKIHQLSTANIDEYLTLLKRHDRNALLHQLKRIERRERCGDIVKFTDLLRLVLLNTFGGVWADATVYCQRSLDEWVDDTKQHILAPQSPVSSRRHEAWLLINLNNCAYAKDWANAFRTLVTCGIDFCDDWKFKRPSLYYWMLKIGNHSPGAAARIWNSRLAINFMKKQPYFSVNYCAESILRKKHRHLAIGNKIFIPFDQHLTCPSRQMIENHSAHEFEKTAIVKLNHKWNCDDLLHRLNKKD